MRKCTSCKLVLDISCFDVKKTGSVSGYCKECRRSKIREHYKKNKPYYLEKAKEGATKLALKLKEYKESCNCNDCGLSFKNKAFLCDFHHIDPSEKDFSVGEIRKYGWKKIKREIEKCIPLCSNCHRIRHYSE